LDRRDHLDSQAQQDRRARPVFRVRLVKLVLKARRALPA
jgi:hypothetical protein